MRIVKNPDQRVAVFVDVQNMYYSARSLYDAKVNFGNLMETALAGRKLVRAIAYVITTGEEDEKEKAFYDALFKAGFDIKQKEVQRFKGGAMKGDWDVGICIDAISMSEKVDSIILLSGDGDYVPLLEYLRLAKGCSVEVVAFSQTCSHMLKDVADDLIDIESDKGRFLISGKSSSLRLHRSGGMKSPAGRSAAPKEKDYATKKFERVQHEIVKPTTSNVPPVKANNPMGERK